MRVMRPRTVEVEEAADTVCPNELSIPTTRRAVCPDELSRGLYYRSPTTRYTLDLQTP